MDVLVTGTAGFIGSAVAARLLERSDRVLGIDNLNDYYDVSLKQARLRPLLAHPGYTHLQADLGDRDAIERAFADFKPQRVVNLAAQAGVRYAAKNPHAYAASNLVGFLHILEGCRHHGVEHLVFASTSSVYGANTAVPFSEHAGTAHPLTFYAATKKANEMMAHGYAHLYGIPTTGLRFFTVYGPYGRPDMAYFKFFKSILDGKTIDVYNHGDMERDFTFVDDVADCVLRILPAPPKPDENGDRYALYNIGNNHPERLERFIEVLEDAAGRRAVKRYLPMQAGDVHMTAADIAETARDFGFCPKTGIEQGLRIFADWYRAYYGVSSTNE